MFDVRILSVAGRPSKQLLTLPIRVGVTAPEHVRAAAADVARIAASTLPRGTDMTQIFQVKPFALSEAARSAPVTPIVYAEAASLVRPGFDPVEVVSKILSRADTRLLILHYALGTKFGREQIARLGELFVKAGLPAFVALGAGSGDAVVDYLRGMFADVSHDAPLDRIVKPAGGDVEALLIAREGTEHLLSLQPMMDEMDAAMHHDIDEGEKRRTFLVEKQPFIHDAQVAELSDQLDAFTAPRAKGIDRLREIRSSGWLHESDGIVPLTELRQDIATAEPPPDVEDRVANPPRVLNAAFQSGPSDVTVLHEDTDAALVVQIGPRWTTRASIVVGSAAFPEAALDDGSSGHVLDVVLVSADLEPTIVQAQLWLPRAGPSAPYVGGMPGPRGSIALPFRVAADAPARIDARLTIYFANTILQSARVACDVGPAGASAQTAPSVRVDYAVTGGLMNLSTYETRSLAAGAEKTEQLNVGLTLLLNDDPSGHRIVAKGSSLPAVWRPYASGNAQEVSDAREVLSARMQGGSPKTFEDFRRDLDALALVGSSLYDAAFQQTDPGAGPNVLLEYIQKLDVSLRTKQVIQIARSGISQDVFPWALVYDIVMDRPDKREYCPSIGTGSLPWTDGPQDQCPYAGVTGHEANVLCPYGFWGFRHIVEQPLSARPPDATDDVREWGERKNWKPPAGPIAFTVGVTRDPKIVTLVDEHLDGLRKLGAINPAAGADSLDTFMPNLGTAELLYFLCHGRRDAKKQAYIALGATGDPFAERVYPSALFQWGRTQAAPALQNYPFVMINGCETAALTADDMVNFVQTLSSLGASGLVGTEVAVPVDFATTFALAFLRKLVEKKAVGRAMYETRWDFARYGNLMGLAYTPYCFADLAVVG